MKKLFLACLVQISFLATCQAMYTDDMVRQRVIDCDWDHIVHQVMAGRITYQQLARYTSLQLNSTNGHGHPLLYYFIQYLSDNRYYLGYTQRVINSFDLTAHHLRESAVQIPAVTRLFECFVKLLNLNLIERNHVFAHGIEDDVPKQVKYNELYQMIVRQNIIDNQEKEELQKNFNNQLARCSTMIFVLTSCVILLAYKYHSLQSNEKAEDEDTTFAEHDTHTQLATINWTL